MIVIFHLRCKSNKREVVTVRLARLGLRSPLHVLTGEAGLVLLKATYLRCSDIRQPFPGKPAFHIMEVQSMQGWAELTGLQLLQA